MAKNLAQALKSDISRLPLRKAAEALRKKGRHGDTMLAHITPKEAAKLKAEGGAGTINPDTGLPEFFDFDFSLPTFDFGGGFGGGNIGGDVGTIDVPTPPARPSDYELSQYNPQTFGTEVPTEQTGSVFSNVIENVSPGQQAMRIGGADPAVLRAAMLGEPINVPTLPVADVGAARAPYLPEGTGSGDAYSTPPGIDKETMDRMAAAEAAKGKGIDTPFGRLGLKEAIAALGLGGMGLNYLNAQAQGKKAAAQLKAAYDQAAAQSRELGQPFMQQGGQQLGQALTGALSPVQQQQLAAGQAQAAQNIASSGGVAAAQAGRSVEDLRQRLLANQQTLALQLLGAGTPLISNAINQQLSGTTTGINKQLEMSQAAGQAAGQMLTMLGAMYARG